MKRLRKLNKFHFYYDYREGWAEGVEISKELELYRQPYCGCIFSERDRYQKIKEKLTKGKYYETENFNNSIAVM